MANLVSRKHHFAALALTRVFADSGEHHFAALALARVLGRTFWGFDVMSKQ